MNHVERIHKHCVSFDIRINVPGAAELAFKKWEAKWRDSKQGERPDLPDKILAAVYLEKTNQHYSVTLFDKTEPIKADTFILHRNDLVWQYSYRHHDFDWFGVGYSIMDYTFHCTVESGFDRIDFGGDYPQHKNKWDPEDGEKWNLTISPELAYQWNRLQTLSKTW